jgi:hypothetical protein
MFDSLLTRDSWLTAVLLLLSCATVSAAPLAPNHLW